MTEEMRKAIESFETSTGVDLLWKEEIVDGDSFCDVVLRNKQHLTNSLEEDFYELDGLGSKVMS